MNDTAADLEASASAERGPDDGPLYLLIANEASARLELDTIAALVEGLAKLAGSDRNPDEDHRLPSHDAVGQGEKR